MRVSLSSKEGAGSRPANETTLVAHGIAIGEQETLRARLVGKSRCDSTLARKLSRRLAFPATTQRWNF